MTDYPYTGPRALHLRVEELSARRERLQLEIVETDKELAALTTRIANYEVVGLPEDPGGILGPQRGEPVAPPWLHPRNEEDTK